MTDDRFIRDLGVALDDLAVPRVPAYFDDVLRRTAATSQRPARSFPRRWFLMTVTTQAVPTASLPWRPVALFLLLAAVLAASIVGILASQPRPAPWFGPANNGLIAFVEDDAIRAADPATGQIRVLRAEATGWIDPWYSPDGRWILLAQEPAANEVVFGIMPADGGEIRTITPEPLRGLGDAEFSPDATSLMVDMPIRFDTANGGGDIRRAIVMIDIQTGAQRVIDAGGEVTDATALPPDGSTLLATLGSNQEARYVLIDVPTGRITPLLQPQSGNFFVGNPQVSPDGRWLAYTDWSPVERRGSLHVRSMTDPADDRVIGELDGIDWSIHPIWSPDGRTIAVEAIAIVDGRDQPRLAFVDVATGVARQADLDIVDGLERVWAPDSSRLLVNPTVDGERQPQLLVDPVSLEVIAAPWGSTSYPTWQRLAD